MWRVKTKSHQRVFLICTDGDQVCVTTTNPPFYQTMREKYPHEPEYHTDRRPNSKEVYPRGMWMSRKNFLEYYVRDC